MRVTIVPAVSASLLSTYYALQVVRGASARYDLTLTAETGRPENLTGARVLLSVKLDVTDENPRVRKDSNTLPSTITIVDALGGVIRVEFVPADTHHLDPGLYRYDLWVIYQDGRRVPVIPDSTLEVLPSITRTPL